MSLIKQVIKVQNKTSYKFNMDWSNRKDGEDNAALFNAFLEMKKLMDDGEVVSFDIVVHDKKFTINKDNYYGLYPTLEKIINPRITKSSPSDPVEATSRS